MSEKLRYEALSFAAGTGRQTAAVHDSKKKRFTRNVDIRAALLPSLILFLSLAVPLTAGAIILHARHHI